LLTDVPEKNILRKQRSPSAWLSAPAMPGTSRLETRALAKVVYMGQNEQGGGWQNIPGQTQL